MITPFNTKHLDKMNESMQQAYDNMGRSEEFVPLEIKRKVRKETQDTVDKENKDPNTRPKKKKRRTKWSIY